METLIIASHPPVAKKRSGILFSPPSFPWSSFSFFVLALAAKLHSHVSTKSGSSRDNCYPIRNAIVVICKVSTS